LRCCLYIQSYTAAFVLIISLHGIAMPKGLYFITVVFFQCLISEVTERISTKLGHIFTYNWYVKNCMRSPPGIYPHRLWGKKRFFGTDFELWPKIFLQWNMISTTRKKLVNVQGLPYILPKFGELWSRNGWERLATFCPPPKVCAQDELHVCDTFWFNQIRQMTLIVDADAKNLVSVGEAVRQAGSRWALPCI